MSELMEFDNLREANVARQKDWCPDQMPDLSFRGNELAGEVGEVCNVIKKLERERLGWRGSRDTVEHLAQELADVVICTDLVAITAGIDLPAVVAAKFNATSESNGLPQRLVFNRDVDPQAMATAPLDVPILVWWPIVAIDEESGDLTDREVGGRWLVTEWNGGHWLEPEVLNALNSNAFDDDMEYARDPRCWIPLPIASGIAFPAVAEKVEQVAPYHPAGIGHVLLSIATKQAEDYVFSPDEGADHYLSDFEKLMLADFVLGLTGNEAFNAVLGQAQEALNRRGRVDGDVAMSRAALDVLAERRRQVEAEGWTAEHDDAHDNGELAMASAAYAYAAATNSINHGNLWPWDTKWWKPSTIRRMLVKSCALGLAAIEKIDRREAREASRG